MKEMTVTYEAPTRWLLSHEPETFEPPAGLTIETITDTGGFLAIADEWNALVRNSSTSAFQTFEWVMLWWKYFGQHPDRDLHVLAFRSGYKLVGIAPFFVQFVFLADYPLLSQLKLLGCGAPTNKSAFELFGNYSPSDFLDVIVRKGFEEEVGRHLAVYLLSLSPATEIILNNVPEEGIIYTWVLPHLRRSTCHLELKRSDVCPRLHITGSMDDYLGTLKSSTRRRFQQARAALRSDSAWHIETIDSAELVNEAFGHLMKLHQRRWNSLGYPGLFSDERFSHFQRDVAEHFAQRGWLWFKTAWHKNTPVASRLGFRFNNRLFDYLSGFDHTLPETNRRPGLALLLSMIEDSVASNCRHIEFLRGLESYKFDFTSEVTYVWDIVARRSASQQDVQVRLCSILQIWRSMIRVVKREIFLLRIHYTEHGSVRFALRYVSFCRQRLLEKQRLNARLASIETRKE